MTGPAARQLVTATRVELIRDLRAGAAAAAAGLPATSCPHSPAGDATERVRVQAWLRGFLRPHRVD